MSASRDRMKALRARRRSGRAVSRAEYDTVRLPYALIRHRFLAPGEEDDPEAIDRAIERLFAAFERVEE